MPLVLFKFVFLPISILTVIYTLNSPGGITVLSRGSGNTGHWGIKYKGNEISNKKSHLNLRVREKKLSKLSSGLVITETFDWKSEISQKSRWKSIRNKELKLKRSYDITKNGSRNVGRNETVHDKRSLNAPNKTFLAVSKEQFYDQRQRLTCNEERQRFKREINSTEMIDACLDTGSCENQLKRTLRYCHCDDLCSILGDCCYNANISFKVGREKPETECIDLHYEALTTIVGCLPEFDNQTVIEDCRIQQSLLQNIQTGLVPVKGDDGFTYKNENCAICNNITRFEHYLVSINLALCHQYEEVENLNPFKLIESAEENGCWISYVTPDKTELRACATDIIPTNASRDERSLCAAFVNPVRKSRGAYYRNVYCAPEEFRKRKRFICIREFPGTGGGKYSLFPLTAMISFRQASKYTTCSSYGDSVLNNGVCAGGFTYHNVHRFFDIELLATSDIDRSFLERTLFFLKVLTSFHPQKVLLDSAYFKVFDLESDCDGRNNGTSLLLINLRYNIIITEKLKTEQVELVKKEFDELKWQYNEYNNASKRVRFLSSVNIENDCNTTMKKETDWNVRPFSQVYLTISLNVTMNDQENRDFCKNNQVNTTVLPEANENGDTLRLDSWVCHDILKTSAATNDAIDFNLILVIATYTGLGLSNVCLIAALIVNRCLLPSFTTPGGNVENVMMSILLSQIMFMVGIGANDNEHVCFVMGVIIHYLIVGVYICMTLSVLHIARTFVSLLKNPATDIQYKPSLRWKMTLLSCTIPAVIVVPCVVMDLRFNTVFNVGYTSGQICFPSAFPANVIVVSGPILACLFMNLSCVFAIMISIFRLSGNFRPWYDRLHLPVLIKLFFFTGLPWVFGILSEFLNNDALRIAFVITYCLQGFFVAVAWTFNRRVLRSLRNKKEKNTSFTSSIRSQGNSVSTEK